ncbi:MAG: DUF4389 domain-containing protein [Spirochaetales bacterium]|nr:DUF4389 domain-containing protein [Spirochaetales bacterium]
MKLTIEHQESYSRGELLLRTFLGAFYIALPHAFVLLFVSFWDAVLTFVKFWVVLFTGEIPQNIYDFQLGLINWGVRLNASLTNLVDGYPQIGVKATADNARVEFENPESVSRGLVIIRALFGAFYVLIPHAFMLFFRQIWGSILTMLAWWVVLFTGKYPEGWHAFLVGTMRWSLRVNLYMGYYTDEYPSFSAAE